MYLNGSPSPFNVCFYFTGAAAKYSHFTKKKDVFTPFHTLGECNAYGAPLHYRLRVIRGGPFGFVNFAYHLICFQIFQIQFLRMK